MEPAQRQRYHTRSIPDSQSGMQPWKVLVAGQSATVSCLTSTVLKDMVTDGSPLDMCEASTPAEARQILAASPEIILLILAPGSDQDKEWLPMIPWIREELSNTRIQITACFDRIIPDREAQLIESYDINDIINTSKDEGHRIRLMVTKALKTVKSFRDLEAKLKRKRQVESQLKEKKDAFNDLIENIGDMVWETGKDHRFSYISANIRTLSGYTQDELHGKSFDYAMDQETRFGAWPEIKTAMAEHKQFTNIDISRIHKDGTPRYFLTSGRPYFDDHGRWCGFRGAEKDITALVHSQEEKKRLIAQLRHAQRLEAMGALAGGIAHDFNNILGGILGYTQLIQFEIKDNPTALGYTEHIISGCNRAKNLILQILDFSRQRECTTPQKPTAPGEIVAEAVKLLRASIPSSIHLKTQIQENAGYILADPSQIHQAVMNLCTNARQAIETGQGEICVRVKSVSLTPENHSKAPELDLDFGEYITIAVTDTGRGIETNTLEKIFNPYFTTKKRGDGTGLGLSVVHGIVTRFNGVITVTTRIGEGSTFTLYFPAYLGKKIPEKENRIRLVQGQYNVLFRFLAVSCG